MKNRSNRRKTDGSDATAKRRGYALLRRIRLGIEHGSGGMASGPSGFPDLRPLRLSAAAWQKKLRFCPRSSLKKTKNGLIYGIETNSFDGAVREHASPAATVEPVSEIEHGAAERQIPKGPQEHQS